MKNKKKVLACVCIITMLLSVFGGCGQKKGNENGTTEISWYLSGVKLDDSYDVVWEKVNELLTEKYDMKLNVVLTDGGNFSQKIQMMNASRESYDLAFTSNWMNSYYTNVENGSLYDITDLLPKYAPKLMETLPDYAYQASLVDGRCYAIPNYQGAGRSMGFLIPEENLKKTGYTMDQLNNFEDLEAYYDAITKADPEMVDTDGSWQEAMTYYGMMTIVQEGLPGVIYYQKDGKPQVINQFETSEFMEFAKMTRRWVEKGIYPAVRTVRDKSGIKKLTSKGEFTNWKVGIEAEKEAETGFKYVSKQISPAILGTEGLISTMTGVGANSEHPEKAVEMLEIINTDKEVYRMLSWGLEGQHYEIVKGDVIRKIEGSKYSIPDWSIGTVVNSFVLEGKPEDVWQQLKARDDAAIWSPLLGFVPDNSVIQAELGNCQTVIHEYLNTIQFGLKDPEEVVPKLIKELKVAGSDTIITEIQKQIDEWWEKNK